MSAPSWVCAGCGASPADEAPFACPQAGVGDVDHVLRAAPPAPETLAEALGDDAEPCPFVRFRALTPTYALARRLKLAGLTVVVEIPQVTGWDWNDVHQRQLHPVDQS